MFTNDRVSTPRWRCRGIDSLIAIALFIETNLTWPGEQNLSKLIGIAFLKDYTTTRLTHACVYSATKVKRKCRKKVWLFPL